MGTTNYGDQLNTFHYRNEATSQSFNHIFHQLLSDGVYEGGILSKSTDNLVNLLPTVAIVSDDIAKVSLRCQTQVNTLIGVSDINNYIIMRLIWVNAIGNYVDIISTTSGGVQASDVVIGRCNYSGATLVNFDYTVQTHNRFDILQTNIDNNATVAVSDAIKYALVLG